jgi:hypothetical protein
MIRMVNRRDIGCAMWIRCWRLATRKGFEEEGAKRGGRAAATLRSVMHVLMRRRVRRQM